MRKVHCAFYLVLGSLFSFSEALSQIAADTALLTPFEKSNKTRTATYLECFQWYKKLHETYKDKSTFLPIGMDDNGSPIYVFRILASEKRQLASAPIKLLINNNIHPGEPEGTDASMMLAREMLSNKNLANWLDDFEIHIICQYNVSGTQRQNCCSRANQDGPLNLGFRGNAKNLDLNRDFIKMDSKNANAFVKYFLEHNFQLFIDNHTSDGADYQYSLTYFHTHPQKLHDSLKSILFELNGVVKKNLVEANWPTAPYVELMQTIPDSGIHAFFETGRYATGFAALHHCLGFCVETHMLKPFPDRVAATYAFLFQFVKSVQSLLPKIYQKHLVAMRKPFLTSNSHYIHYVLDSKTSTEIDFLGYQAEWKKSEITGAQKLAYNHNQPYNKKIKYYSLYRVTDSVQIPNYYIIPQAWKEVIDRLEANRVEMRQVSFDTLMPLKVYYIENYKTVSHPYEGHYMHFQTQTKDTTITIQLKMGDYLISTKQGKRNFIVSVLEPRAPDSYFNWNFFDGILMQKEGYSSYIWEEKALKYLQENPTLRKKFEQRKKLDAQFANDPSAQLHYLYLNSPYYEFSHNLYPVYRLY